ncbi:hypothetical protein GCM10010271_19140 [Streptomyces kurssanovii]|nr:hypothetical protein GCM10010271_19140 [Streptomyces kurssanovii]
MTPAMTSLFVFIGPPLVVYVVGVAFTSQTEDDARVYVSGGEFLPHGPGGATGAPGRRSASPRPPPDRLPHETRVCPPDGVRVAAPLLSRGASLVRTVVLSPAAGQRSWRPPEATRKRSRKDAAGKITTFAYDYSDQLAEAVNDDATVTWLRDRYCRLVSETVNGRTISYTYDALGRRTGRTTPTGAVSTWTYDTAGRRTSLTTSGRTITFRHDAAGQEIARHIGDTVSFTNQYDPLGRLTNQHVTTGDRSIQRRDYTYRADGNLIALTDQLSGTRTFDLDPVGRVTAVRAAGWTERYAYDEAGNQTEPPGPQPTPVRKPPAYANTPAPASPVPATSATNTTPSAASRSARRPASPASRTPGATNGTPKAA